MSTAVKTIKEQTQEFWLKPENYGQIPSRIAFEIFKEQRISFAELLENIRSEPDVDETFEGLCEEVARHQFPDQLSMKREDNNYYQFLEERFMSQDSEESDREDRMNEEKKKEYEKLKDTMLMVSGINPEIQKHLDLKRKMMRINPMIGLKIQDHPKWVMWSEFSEEEKEKYITTFWKIFHKDEEMAPIYAEQAVKKMRKRRIQKTLASKKKAEKKAKKMKAMELKEQEKENRRLKEVEAKEKENQKAMEIEEEKKQEEVAVLVLKIFNDCTEKDSF